MRFTAALLFGLVAADKSYYQKRQGDGIAGVFALLKPMVESLDQAINAYTGGPGDDVIGQSKKIAAQVKSSTQTVNAVGQLDISAASSLVAPVQDFTTSLEKTINDLIAHKQVSVANGLGPKVYANLEDQLSGATGLANAIKSKMPSTLAATADELSGKILDALNKGISAFKDVATAGAGAGAGAGAAGSSPSSSTSASGSAGGAGASLSAGGSTFSGPSGSSSSGMGAMGSMPASGSASGSVSGSASGSASYGASGSYDASSPQTTSARGSSPAVFTGAGASFKPASVFGLVAVAAAVFAL